MIFSDQFIEQVLDEFNNQTSNPDRMVVELIDNTLESLEDRELGYANSYAEKLIYALIENPTTENLRDLYKTDKGLSKLIGMLSIIKNSTETTESDLNNVKSKLTKINNKYKKVNQTDKVKKVMPQHLEIYTLIKDSFYNIEFYNAVRHINNIPKGLFSADPFKVPKIDGLTIRLNYTEISKELRKYLY